MSVHQHGRVGKEPVIEPVSERGDWPPKTYSKIVRRPPRQHAVALHQRHILGTAVEEKVAKNGRETPGIHGIAGLVHSRWQLVWPKLNRALRQIVHHQAGLQGWQHHQYRPYGKNRGKITVLKKSLQEIQHPGSGSIRFHRFPSIWPAIVADLPG
jgi:hypothetical protein